MRRAVCGCFTVAKKDDWLRLIFDVRAANFMCRNPPKTSLSTSIPITRIRLRHSNTSSDRLFEGIIVSFDLCDGFYQFWWPALAQHFSMDLVCQADEIGASTLHMADGSEVPCKGDDLGFPCLATVPMGFSWGVYFCHSVMVRCAILALQMLGLSDAEAVSHVVTDGRESQHIRPGRPVAVVYVDNCCMLCWDAIDQVLVRRAMQNVFDMFGLSFKLEHTVAAELPMVGILLNLQTGLLINKPDRVWRLRGATLAMVRQRRASPLAMQILILHLVNASIVKPCMLSIFAESFRLAFLDST